MTTVSKTTSVREAVGYDVDLVDIDLLIATYPKNFLLPIGSLMDELDNHTPPHIYNDYVEFANEACSIYCRCSEFFSIDDEVFDGYDYDAFTREIGASDSPHFRDYFNAYMAAVCSFVRGILDLLVDYQIPFFVDQRCTYVPDSIDMETKTLILRLDVDNL